MANKLKELNRPVRDVIATRVAKDLRRQNPHWTLQQIHDAAYRVADLRIKRGAVRVS